MLVGKGGGEGRKQDEEEGQQQPKRHMLLEQQQPLVVPDRSKPSLSSSFLKDGRTIYIGDCALFQSGDSPPFIGIIRWLSSSKEDHLRLGVNWLYRPADVKLPKGVLLETTPNEVFYSFHEDEISPESLLHPCKVAFLRKGVELPSGISSFVCRRVYDIANKRLWWLTDQDFTDERQEEIDQLLGKSHLAMHRMVQLEGYSPKRCLTAAQQLKSGSDSIENSSTSVPSQGKGKKRDKVEQTDFIKRLRGPKACDGDSDSSRHESMIKSQLAKITDKGGLINSEGVEILLNLMQLDGSERKLELAGRVLLADVIAATDRFDCLCRFMHLKGLLVLGDWLQEAHKSKTGDLSLKESDKSVEELLLALLRALDKLPVDLHALQTSNIGKYVNNLRTHKNVEVQKKARSLVDTWKKRVDEEMTKINDVKPGSGQSVSLSAKPSFTEASHETGTCRTSPVKSIHGEASLKSSIALPGNTKSSSAPSSVAIHTKELQCKSEGTSGTTEVHATMPKEEKSSGSSQSLGNRQSCSSDHRKTMGTSCKEDARRSANPAKTSGGTSKHQKSSNGVLEAEVAGIQKEINSGKSLTISKHRASDKVSQYGVTCEGRHDFPVADGNNKRLIIKFQRNSSQSGSGDYCEENSVLGSRASSPGSPSRHDKSDLKRKVKDTCQANIATDINVETKNNDTKRAIMSKEDDRSPSALYGSHKSTDENGKAEDIPKGSSSSSGKEKGPFLTESKSGKSSIHSFNSMIALVESCVKHSEPNASLSVGDDLGMDLLASVATGEMSKCDPVPSVASPVRKSLASDGLSTADEVKSRFQNDNVLHQGPSKHGNDIDSGSEKDISNAFTLVERGKLQLSCAQALSNVPGDGKNSAVSHEHESLLEHSQSSANPVSELNEQNIGGEPTLNCPTDNKGEVQEKIGFDAANYIQEKLNSEGHSSDCLPSQKEAKFPPSDKDMVISVQEKTTVNQGLKTKEAVENSELLIHMDIDKQDTGNEGLDAVIAMKPDLPLLGGVKPAAVDDTEILKSEKPDAETLVFSGSDIINSGFVSGLKSEKSNDLSLMSYSEPCDSIKKKQTSPNSPVLDDNFQSTKVVLCTGDGAGDSQGHKIQEHPTALATQEETPIASTCEGECVKHMDSKVAGNGADELASSALNHLATDKTAKCDFDLNEGVMGDEGNQGESASSHLLKCSSVVALPKLAPFTVPLVSSSSTVPITVASPAKGPFFPPENLLKSKAALGWKGSAATSAFRPTDARKVVEMSLSTSEVSTDDAVVKEDHPPLGIDLNVPDERVLEEMDSHGSVPERCFVPGTNAIHGRTFGGLDLDLNKADEDAENSQFSLSTSRKLETPPVAFREFPNGEVNGLRQFDLNDGPGLEEVHIEPVPRNQQAKNSMMPLTPPVADLKMSKTELGSLSSWLPQGNSCPSVAIAPLLTERGDQTYPIAGPAGAQRMLGSAVGGVPFGGDMYRGPMLSSPAMAFSSAAAFPYTGFPFNLSYPLAPASFSGGATTYLNSSSGGGPCFPAVSSQIVGPANAASSAYVRPYLASVPDSNASGSGSDNGRKWGKHCLDLNAGPKSLDTEGREEKLPPTLRQPSITFPHAFVEEHGRIYHVPGGGVKRKEPESGWDTERFTYKQPSWQ